MTIGRIVWFDLMTTNPAAAPDFYGAVIGWKAHQSPGYGHWQAPDSQIGGFAELPAEAKAMGVPPHWMGYTQVADVDEAVERAQKLGAQVHVPPTEIPSTGRFAVLGDPQGATFAVYAHGPNSNNAPNDQKGIGQFAWCELMTSDLEGAQRFYGELFGWKETGSMDMGPEMGGKYSMFGQADNDMIGGMMRRPPQMDASAWVYYFRVPDCDAAYSRAKELGATDYYAPMDIPGGGRACLVADPQGAVFGLVHDPKK